VTDKTAVLPYIHDIHAQTGHIDILINNAAYVQWDPISQMSIEQAERTMAVGYNGMVTTIKTILPLMQAAGRGHIVNIASIAGLILVGGTSAAYAGTKAAIDTYTRILQMELAGSPIQATVVRLSTVAGTNFFKKHVPMSRMAPLSKYFAPLTPPDVATAVLRAIAKKQEIVYLPWYTHPTYLLYVIAPRFSRWLSKLGGANKHDYANVDWKIR
jgi:short-subunit dehydrogenase